MDQTFHVTLTGQAKVNGVREPAGKSVPVTLALALQLAAAGVINPDLVPEASSPVIDVAAIIAERDAHWSTALDHFETMAEDQQADAIAALEADHAEGVKLLDARRAQAEADATSLRARVAELEAAALNNPAGQKGAAQKKA